MPLREKHLNTDNGAHLANKKIIRIAINPLLLSAMFAKQERTQIKTKSESPTHSRSKFEQTN